MTMLIKDHAHMLGVRGKTVARLKAVEIETVEDLADASIDLIVWNLRCTTERAKVLINRAKRAVRRKMPHPAHGPGGWIKRTENEQGRRLS